MVIGGSLVASSGLRWSDSVVGGSACGWVGQLVMGESVVVGFVVRNQWWEDWPVNGFRRMGRRWWVGSGSGWVWEMRSADGWRRLCFDFGVFFFF